MSELTRRQFLHSAGGLIFLLLVPVGRGLFAAPDGAGGSLPRFTALPYVQPGPSSRLLAGEESVGIAWQTEAHPAGFALDYGPTRQYGKPALHRFIADDLTRTDARWKFVVYHHPAFNVGDKHYAEQHMRVLSPLLEQHGVDFCLHGHEHVYQRTMPLRFRPTDAAQATPDHGAQRLVPGVLTVDYAFDGKTETRPDGILYITTGAGGKELYDPDQDESPDKWLHPEDNNAAYNARFHSSAHSLTIFDLDGSTLTMTQIDETGREIDRITVNKA